MWQVDGGGCAGFGQPVALQDRHADGVEPFGDIFGQRRGTGDEEPDPAAEPLPDRAQHQLVRQGQLGLQQDAGLLLLLTHPGPLDTHADGPVVDLRFQPAAALRGERHLRPDLLEDPRCAAHERRLDDAEVFHDPGQVTVDRGGEAELQLDRGEHFAQHVGHGQPQVLDVVGAQDIKGCNGFALVGPVVVDESNALGAAGRAGGVDQRRQVLRAAVGDPLVDEVGLVLQARLPAGGQLVHRQRCDVVGALRGAVEQHNGLEAGQAGVHGLFGLLSVLGEDHHRLGVTQDERDITGGRRRVHRGGGPAGAEDREIGQDPLDSGGRCDRHPLLRLQAEVDQAGGEVEHPVLGLRPGQRFPVVTDPVAKRFALRGLIDPIHKKVSERLGSLGQRRGHFASSLTPEDSVDAARSGRLETVRLITTLRGPGHSCPPCWRWEVNHRSRVTRTVTSFPVASGPA